jgi:hypothetical protein
MALTPHEPEYPHAGGSDARVLRESLITKHGSLKLHYRARATDCDRAIALMTEFSKKGVFQTRATC